MKLHDPERLMIAGRPAYGRPAIAALPPLSCWPLDPLRVRVSAMLEYGVASFRWFHAEVPASELPGVLARYEDDPEGLLAELFGYEVREQDGPVGASPADDLAPAESGIEISADDLDF
jgi:hypothetical protein